MNNDSEKAIQLAIAAHNIVVYREIIDTLETQLSYYRKKVNDAQKELEKQHADFLKPTNTVDTLQLKG